MQELLEPILKLFKPETLIQGGYILMTAVVFVETGLLIGFFLPGDSLLVTAGIFAARGELNILYINLLLIPAAILGDTVGYWIGYLSGPKLFNRKKSLVFNPEHLNKAHEFYEQHGGKTIVIARFMPIVRTFAPVVAGMGKMNYRSFLLYNVFGGIGWVASMSLVGYFLGKQFPGAVKRLEVIILVVVFISILPGIIGLMKAKWSRSAQPRTQSVAPAAESAPVLEEGEARTI